MVYIGHFSFDEIGAQDDVRHGYFSCVVEANNAETAANEFKELIFSLKKMDDIFGRIVAVYMEDIVELRTVQQRAIVTRIQSSVGEFPKSISKSLPHIETPGINVYTLTSEVDADVTDRGRMNINLLSHLSNSDRLWAAINAIKIKLRARPPGMPQLIST